MINLLYLLCLRAGRTSVNSADPARRARRGTCCGGRPATPRSGHVCSGGWMLACVRARAYATGHGRGCARVH
eukprot:12654444-Alexandrium_andersonii.AAC.1